MPLSNDPRFADPMSRAPAGYSLTQPKGKWPWDKPPRFVDPNEVVSYIIDQVEKPRAKKRYLKLMLAGITIEEIVNSIAIGGFSTGNFTPDVAELIKGPIATYFMGLADENNIPVRVFSTPNGAPEDDDDLDDISILNIMKTRNPKVYREMIQMQNDVTTMAQMELDQEEGRMDGFLAVEPQDIEDAEIIEEVPEQQEAEEE